MSSASSSDDTRLRINPSSLSFSFRKVFCLITSCMAKLIVTTRSIQQHRRQLNSVYFNKGEKKGEFEEIAQNEAISSLYKDRRTATTHVSWVWPGRFGF